jgi:hypothetical protein
LVQGHWGHCLVGVGVVVSHIFMTRGKYHHLTVVMVTGVRITGIRVIWVRVTLVRFIGNIGSLE